MRSLKRNRL